MILLPLKEKTPMTPKIPGGPAPIGGAQRLGRVLDHRDPMTGADPQDASVVGALAVEVDHYHRLRQAAPLRAQSRSSSSRRPGSMFHDARSLSMNTGEAPT